MRTIKRTFIIVVITLITTFGCKEYKGSETETSIVSAENLDEEFYRPNYHFTPKANWMNDPNGMFYLNGTYHLYFQHYPEGNVWGPMHWGHATSKDLIQWEEQPIALYPDELGLIFSGSAVVDKDNTSGFGKDGVTPVVAIYTYHNMDGEKAGDIDFQTQGIAYSLDEGMTWTKYSDNPVIKNPGIKDFRDPKVIWHNQTNKWIMSLAAGNKIMFYSSANLIDWTLQSEFGADKGEHGGVWECPDLFPIKVEGTDEEIWVLLVSINPSGPNGGSATQYFIGDFNGQNFTLDWAFANQLKRENAVWLDYGRDNYAGVTWSNIPEDDGRRLFIGWMSNWDYARDVPTYKWRSTMTIPRTLKLKKQNNDYYIASKPVAELNNFVEKNIEKEALSIETQHSLLEDKNVDLSKAKLSFTLSQLKNFMYSVKFYNTLGDTLTIGLDNANKTFFIDRRQSGKVDFSKKFAPKISTASYTAQLKAVNIDIVLDKTSVEVFYNNGMYVMTELFFPNAPFDDFSIVSEDQSFLIDDLKIETLKIP
ncbi:glycoside hydrolase family 32 protein [uncultured Winogradskyella sp.]|uniref:glycoside hydrolase family 32 protein n=1 Tax=uncultured Winogradskyella sp. TaxID=395353 RepID=UPI0026071E20|nr:glycoside hydrolase family 32 protein [uncultured Winogradskyella sp.]